MQQNLSCITPMHTADFLVGLSSHFLYSWQVWCYAKQNQQRSSWWETSCPCFGWDNLPPSSCCVLDL